MTELNYFAIAVAAVAVFMLSSVYYTIFGQQMAQLSEAYADPGRPPAWRMGVELVRNVVLATVVAGLSEEIGIDGWLPAVGLAVALWIGFPLVLWTGAIIWERVPWRLAAIHGGDWLMKLLVATVIVSVWR